jgi:hypothetical protein
MARSPRHRRTAALVVAALAAGLVSALATGPASAEQVEGGPDRGTVSEAVDHASEAFADPWDYGNSADIHVGTPQMSHGGQVKDGLLRFVTATQYPWIDPVPYLPGSTPLDRDGPSAPIDTSRYKKLSVRMYSSVASAGLVLWSTCDWSRNKACNGAMGVPISAGWHTYDWTLKATDRNAPAAWAGKALQLRFIPASKQGADIRVDWMRLHADAAPVRFTFQPAHPGGRNEVFWESVGAPTSTDPATPRSGSLGAVTGTSVDFPYAAFPPGTYRLVSRSGDVTGPYTAPLTVLPRPRPVIDSPSLAGGADYATTVRKAGWNFSSLKDVGRRANVCNARILTGGILAANNCGSEIDNPFFFLPNPTPIDGNTWHRLTVRLRYDGPFGLTGGPTGGAVARLIWYVKSNPAADQNVHDLVVYPGWQTITVDLKTNPPAAVTDETQKARRIGWAGQTITGLRLDPNEDVSARRWYVDYVRLTRDDAGTGGRFTLAFRETAGLPGQTATVFLARDRKGTAPVKVATKAVVAGRNTVAVSMPTSLRNGSYWPYVVISGPSGSVTAHAAAPVTLTR